MKSTDSLLDKVALLRALADDVDDAFCRRVQEAFRENFERIFEADKLAYVQEVIDKQYLSYEKLAELLGFSGASAITNLKKTGSIRLEKFELLRATIGQGVRWPSPEDRKAQVLVDVITQVQQQTELRKPSEPPLSVEGYYALKFALGGDRALAELILEREEEAWVAAVLERVHKCASTHDLTSARDVRALIDQWSPAFVRTQLALLSFVR